MKPGLLIEADQQRQRARNAEAALVRERAEWAAERHRLMQVLSSCPACCAKLLASASHGEEPASIDHRGIAVAERTTGVSSHPISAQVGSQHSLSRNPVCGHG